MLEEPRAGDSATESAAMREGESSAAPCWWSRGRARSRVELYTLYFTLQEQSGAVYFILYTLGAEWSCILYTLYFRSRVELYTLYFIL